MTIRPRLSHLFMLVGDLAGSRRFYTDALGLEVLMEHPGYVRIGGGDGFHIGMEEGPPEKVGAAGIEVSVWVEDCDAAYQRALAQGATAVDPPADSDWGTRYAALLDPSGYRVSLQSEVPS
jgi:catechol 2,3-dioxygenase-like lactoylglutathione lyase family enzyme